MGLISILVFSLMSIAGDSPVKTIQKKCEAVYKKNTKTICYCITSNLSSRLTPTQLRTLAQIYKDGTQARIMASKQKNKRPLMDIDYEVNVQCSKNAGFKLDKEDLGQPDSL